MTPLLDYSAVPEPYNAPRQALPTVYWHCGTVDTCRATTLRGGSMTGDAILPLIVSPELAIDIDSLSDLQRAAVAPLDDCVLPGALPSWENVRMLVLDVDGTLTPGEIYYGPDGEMLKRFHTHDGRGIEMIQNKGVKVAIITQESSAFTAARAKKLHIDEVHMGATDKVAVLQDVCRRNGIGLDEVAYIGDDLGDHAALTAVGLAGGVPCAVADARPEILDVAHFVTGKRGGFGAVRDVCDQILFAATRR
jgi:3-deoxy-D-manno-octulosonate 8-phosphate phosphatase (KDO 8-P phosphatase)